MSVPTAEEQVIFLQQVQRLFNEGEFSATYKYALLLSLAELAVEMGNDSGATLDLPIQAVAEKFAELYWRQLPVYSSGQPQAKAGVLSQNNGVQAAVVRHLIAVHRITHGNLNASRRHNSWRTVISSVAAVVRAMPLKHLQMLGGTLNPFLYDYPSPLGVVRLRPGVAFNLRRYQALIQQFARAGWVSHVRSNKLNAPILGKIDDLETFMFGSLRTSLADVAKILAPIQSHRCFYCNTKVDGRADVDHFIPWVRYPRDTAHNFVLAHSSCNNAKRDLLAAKRHLSNWVEHIELRGEEIGGMLNSLGIVSDRQCSMQVARWAYQNGIDARSLGWVRKGMTEPLTENCLELLE